MDTVRESALKVDWEKIPLPLWGIKPAVAVYRSNALPTELHPHAFTYKYANTFTNRHGLFLNSGAECFSRRLAHIC